MILLAFCDWVNRCNMERKMWSFLKTLQPLILLGFKTLLPFFLLCIDNITTKNYRIMLSRNHWKALFTMVWGWLFSSVIWREEKFWFVRFVPKVRTLDFPSVFNGFRTNWDFRNMIESITTIRNRHRIKAKLLISLYFTKVKWYFIPFIYTVMDKKSKS